MIFFFLIAKDDISIDSDCSDYNTEACNSLNINFYKEELQQQQSPLLIVPVNPSRSPVPQNLNPPLPFCLNHRPLLAAAAVADALFEKNKQTGKLTYYYVKCLQGSLEEVWNNMACAKESKFRSISKSEDVEELFGYRFENINLLRLARVAASGSADAKKFQKINNNEQLEVLGDAVLQIITTHWLYFNFPTVSEEILTDLRSCLVCNEFQAKCLWRFWIKDKTSILKILLVSKWDVELKKKLEKFEVDMKNENDDEFEMKKFLK